MFSSHSAPEGTMGSSALNLAGPHANTYAMDQTRPHEEVIFDEIV